MNAASKKNMSVFLVIFSKLRLSSSVRKFEIAYVSFKILGDY